MKHIFKSLLIGALLMLAAVLFLGLPSSAQAQQPATGLTANSATGTWTTTNGQSIISAQGAGTPVVTYLYVGSDLSTSKISFYNSRAAAQANYVSTTVSLPVTQTNGFAAGDVIVIQHVATDTYERRVLSAFLSATNLTVTVAPTTALAVGDVVWDEALQGTIPWGATTNSIIGNGIIAGHPGEPLLIEVNGTASASVYTACATYK